MINKHACQKTPARSAITPEPPPQTEAPAFANESDPITQNLDETQQEIDKWSARVKGPLPDMMTNWVIPLYMQAIREELKTVTDNTQRLKLLTQHSLTAARLQRAADSSAKRQLERERVDLEKEKFRLITAPAIEKKRPDYLRPLTDIERHAIIAKVDDVMGIGPTYTRESFEANYHKHHGAFRTYNEPDTQPATSNAVPEAPVSTPSHSASAEPPAIGPTSPISPIPATATTSAAPTPTTSVKAPRRAKPIIPITPIPPIPDTSEPSLSSSTPADTAAAVPENPSIQSSIHSVPAPAPTDPGDEYELCLFRMRTNQEPWDQKKLNRLKSAIPSDQPEDEDQT